MIYVLTHRFRPAGADFDIDIPHVARSEAEILSHAKLIFGHIPHGDSILTVRRFSGGEETGPGREFVDALEHGLPPPAGAQGQILEVAGIRRMQAALTALGRALSAMELASPEQPDVWAERLRALLFDVKEKNEGAKFFEWLGSESFDTRFANAIVAFSRKHEKFSEVVGETVGRSFGAYYANLFCDEVGSPSPEI